MRWLQPDSDLGHRCSGRCWNRMANHRVPHRTRVKSGTVDFGSGGLVQAEWAGADDLAGRELLDCRGVERKELRQDLDVVLTE